MEFVKAADEEVADETIEAAGVVAKQVAKAVGQVFAQLARDECEVSGHSLGATDGMVGCRASLVARLRRRGEGRGGPEGTPGR